MTSDPVDIASALIANRRPFVLALVIGVAGLANEYAGDMTIFASNGTVLAGNACGLGAESQLQEGVRQCFASESPMVMDIELVDGVIDDCDARPAGVLKIYLEAVVPRARRWQPPLERLANTAA
ncbi:XdhC family protein [Cupriavidus sp. RAF12]|uniref:XdhC family protein n=1 Tax=Cupriavidus sp. RAF12 TaxID=3233050 RepID=UPI003F8FFDFE